MAQLRLAVPAITALLVLIFLFGVEPPEFPVTTYGAASELLWVTGRVAGLALIAAGALVFLEAGAPALGAVAMASGLAWWAPDVVGWEDGSPLARSVAAVVAPFSLPLVLHLTGALPRWIVRATYAVAAVVSAGWALLRDPFEDADCWSNCTDNVFLAGTERGVVEVLDGLWLVAALVAGAALAVVAIARVTRSWRGTWPVLAPAVLVGLGEAAYAATRLSTPEHPERLGFAAVYLVRSTAAVALAAGIAWTVLAARRGRTEVARLGVALGEAPAPGTLETVLARSLQDPGLQVGYRLPGEQRHVGTDGRALPLPPPGGARATTRIARGGEHVAVVLHDAALLDGPALEREIGAAARLAVDNERLQAAVRAQLEDLRASRARIVASGDAARRLLERDLHDGAQQRLLALSYELRLAGADATADPELAALLRSAVDAAGAALEDLRELAHGIYPAILAEAGLAPAVATLAETAPLPVEIGGLPDRRHPEPVEVAAYLTIVAAVEDAAARHATYAGVSAVRDGDDLLVVEVTDDGTSPHGPLVEVADRVGALGGRLVVAPEGLVAELPCA